ncbi:MAG: hypothetical protein ABI781_18025 [Burkholderiales bacterium]
MSYAQPKQYFAATNRAVTSAAAHVDAIEWEELPSLAGSLAKRLVRRVPMQDRANDSAFMNSRSFASPWDNTMPASLDIAPPSQPFREPLEGLATREINEPGVFHHFFGTGIDA